MFRSLSLVLALGLPSIHGAVTWDADRVDLRTTSLDSKVTAIYQFKNTGTVNERVMSVEGGCSCTVPRNAGAVVAPGENGVIEIDFLIGDRTGLQERVVTVVTKGEKEDVHQLNLSVRVEDVVAVRPRLLFWTRGEAPNPKRTEIVVSGTLELEFDPPVVQGGGFKAALEPSRESNSRALVLTPDSVDTTRNSEIKLTVRHAGREKTLVVFALVR